MALARVVSFDGVDSERIEALATEIREGNPPEGLPASEMLLLHDPDANTALAVIFFESEEDYRKGDELLGSMPTSDTPGTRTAVTKYDVAARATA
jgi:hypothetical protein